MTKLAFTRATKRQAKARIALAGPSGSGKTYTALTVARTLGGPVAVIDTEHGSASKYADLFEFDTLPLDRYDPAVLVDALAVAGANGYPVAIVDSLSHFWMGVDGMLEQVDRAAKRSASGNTFGGWKEMRPVERRMVEALLAYPGHVIVTMRTKTEWVIEENDRGKKVPRKIGTKAEQRDGIEYEFDLVGDLDLENELIVSKSRCPALAGAVVKRPGEDFAHTIMAWLQDGTPAGPTATDIRDRAVTPGRTRDELLEDYQQASRGGLLGAPVVDGTGEPATLADLLVALGKAAAARPVSSPPATPVEGAATRELHRWADAKLSAAEDDDDLINDAQLKRLHTLFGLAHIADRDGKLAFCSEIAGRDVVSTGELTKREGSAVMDVLEAALAEAKEEVPA